MQTFNSMIRTARMASESKAAVLGGNSMAAHMLRQMVLLAAQSGEAVQITGADAAGHIDLARAIHGQSSAATDGFIDASRDDLISHDRVATGQTVFVGDVSRLSAQSQEALLTCTARMVSTRPESIADAAKICPHLQAKLSKFSIPYPPLAARKDDIPIMLQRLWAGSSYPLPPVFERTAWSCMLSHGWPGNFGELRRLAERLSRDFGGRTVDADNVRSLLRGGSPAKAPPRSFNLKDHLAEEEKLYLIEALLRSHGVVQQAATLSGLKRTTFLAKMKKHGLARM
jgi:DNA-binding NtrC family response regulator